MFFGNKAQKWHPKGPKSPFLTYFCRFLLHFRASKYTLMRWQDSLRRIRNKINLIHDIEQVRFVLIQGSKGYGNVRNELDRKLRIELPNSFSHACDIVHICTKMAADDQKQIVA